MNNVVPFRPRGLDINTPRGQQSLADEAECIRIFHHYAKPRGLEFISTDKSSDCAIDGYIVERTPRGKVVRALVEQKSRSDSRATFARTYNDEWLLTYDKVELARQLAAANCACFMGFLYLVPDQLLLTIKITGVRGDWLVKSRTAWGPSQQSCNGGSAYRLNAYIPLATARTYRAPPPLLRTASCG